MGSWEESDENKVLRELRRKEEGEDGAELRKLCQLC